MTSKMIKLQRKLAELISLNDLLNNGGGRGGQKVSTMGVTSGRGQPHGKYLNLEKSRIKEGYDQRKTVDFE